MRSRIHACASYPHPIFAVRYKLFKGKKTKKSFLGRVTKGDYRQCGVFKGIVRVIYHEDDVAQGMEWLEKLRVPVGVRVRFYAMKGFDFQDRDDDGGTSHPYLKLRLGKNKISDRANYIEDSSSPEIFRCFEFNTTMPGASQLVVQACDADMLRLKSDDLIGQTTIDLEDRWFCHRWQNIGTQFQTSKRYRLLPTERRSLFYPGSELSQGELECWVEIMTAEEDSKYVQPFPSMIG